MRTGSKLSFKKLCVFVSLLVAIYALLGLANNLWIDQTDVNETKTESSVKASLLIWSVTPSFDRKKDSTRLIKLSQLNAGSVIYKQRGKFNPETIEVLVGEAIRLTNYLEQHGGTLSDLSKDDLFLKVLMYFNRVDVLNEKTGASSFGSKIDLYVENRNRKQKDNDEDWLWEMSIRHKISGASDQYHRDIEQLRELSLKNHSVDLSSDFISGVIDFHEGVLACVVKDQDGAEPFLHAAFERLRNYGLYLSVFIARDFNAFLYGKGMRSGGLCRTYIESIISIGG